MRVFLDFEASSLSKHSYPIEVGWVAEDGAGEAHLIRPAPEWTEWDASAEAVHRISRVQLMDEGEPHEAVCMRLIGLFDGNVVHAGAPSWDGHWLSMLLRAAGKPRHLLRLADTEAAFVGAAQERLGPAADEAAIAQLIAEAQATLDRAPAAHRALEDARRDWRIWREIRGN